MEDSSQNFIKNVIGLVNNPITNDDALEKEFSDMIMQSFSIEKINFLNIYKKIDSGQEYSYILNSKKIFIDNELSEYSTFTKSIEYKNKGYRSYAVIPIFIYTKPVLILELLSTQKNKFTQEAINAINLGAFLLSMNLLQRQNIRLMDKLGTYFNVSFNLEIPQLIVDSNNKIIKSNKSAINELGIDRLGNDLNSVLGIGFDSAKAFKNSKIILNNNIYKVNSSTLNENTAYITLTNITNSEILENMLESIEASKNTFVMLLDNNLNIQEVTSNFDEVSGKLIIGKNFTDFISSSQKNDFLQKLSVLDEKNSFEAVGDLSLLINEKPMFIRFSLKKYLRGFIAMLSDATAEKYISDIKQDFDEFMKNTSDMVLITDELGFIKSSNICIESVLGYKPNEIIGADIKQLYVNTDILDRDFKYARNNGKIDNSYITLIKKGGEKISAIHFLRMLKSIDNSISYIILIKELETKHMIEGQEDELKRQKNQIRKLIAASELKSQFIYNISHELKTPLTNIKGFSKLLYTNEFGELNSEQKEYMKTILDETDRLMLIIQQVLDASKLDANKIKLDMKEIDFNSLYNTSTIKSLEDAITNKGLKFQWKTDYDVPKIYADPNRLMQVLVNLIGNAIKFTEKGEISVHIFKKNKRNIQCEIKDNGIGIDDDDKHKLFKKFYQATKKDELVQQHGAGTGLGLAITKDIINLHKGKIGFESEKDKGTTFWFSLPIKQKAA